MSPSKSDKDYLKALLLCLLIGGFGAHRYYLGRWISATFLCMGFVTLLFGIASLFWANWIYAGIGIGYFFITLIWASVDAIMLALGRMPDAKGHYVMQNRTIKKN